MYILLFLLIFIIVIIILGLSIVGAILRAVFGIGRRSSSRPKQKGQYNPGQHQYQQNESSQHSTRQEEESFSEEMPRNKRKKIFTKDEGEYVDFEEM